MPRPPSALSRLPPATGRAQLAHPEVSLLQAELSQFSQPFLIAEVLYPLMNPVASSGSLARPAIKPHGSASVGILAEEWKWDVWLAQCCAQTPRECQGWGYSSVQD
ncbi:hypothetical protein DUI87_14032 [Hirundo rustica rustica]|uniref:Uncharacterized protein n=1 Tax=Hirundo rustica rustica TaxID=333673 RepID=A0A3M0K795_HIRRU|nr:hypothetical protein DUI87_14032 [Hirundo rustica rustica]